MIWFCYSRFSFIFSYIVSRTEKNYVFKGTRIFFAALYVIKNLRIGSIQKHQLLVLKQ